MRLFVVRHGQSVANVQRIHSGWGAFSLTETGREQARQTGKALEGLHFDRIFVSDLPRTQETARLLLPQEVHRFELRADVREYDMKQFVGVSVDEMYCRFGEPYLRMRAQQDYTDIGCETPEHFVQRVAGFLAEIQPLAGTALLVTHEGVGKCIGQVALGTPFRSARLRTANCGVSVLESQPDGGWKMLLWNWTPDLTRFL